MVEGPGATRNGKKVQPAVGKSVINTDMEPMFLLGSSNPVESCQLYTNKLRGSILNEAFTIGKELFLIFSIDKSTFSTHETSLVVTFDESSEIGRNDVRNENIALRIHFGMNGTLMISKNGREPSVPKWRKPETPTMRITLGSKNLHNRKSPAIDKYFHKSFLVNNDECSPPNIVDLTGDGEKNPFCISDGLHTSNKALEVPIEFIIEIRRATISFSTSATSARTKLSRLKSSDVCGPFFSHEDVFQNFTKVIEDNNIKQSETVISDAILNQNLFPGIGNIIKVESLHRAKIDPRRHLSSLSNYELKLLIEHCRDFSMYWLKFGRTPTKYVYNQTVCGTCNKMSVKMQKIGGDNKNKMKHLARIEEGHDKITSSLRRVTFWCIYCQPMQPQMMIKLPVQPNLMHINQPEMLELQSIDSNKVTQIATSTKRSSQIDDSNHTPKEHVFNPYKRVKKTITTDIASVASSKKVFNPYKKVLITPSKPISDKIPSSICPIHGSSSVVLRRVRKEGPNKLRLFYSCKNQNCSFFIWADTHFPFCHCHGNSSTNTNNNQKTILNRKQKKAILRVSKTERSGGKWFLCCANGQDGGVGKKNTNYGCGYFEWATTQLLEPIKKHITPLL